MRELDDKVAVVTGAASGIGRALARRFAREGMRLVVADVEAAPLDAVAAEVTGTGGVALAVPTDVSDGAQVEALARRAYDAFGAVHVLCNNAGVALSGPVWEYSEADWRWILGVNLWGVIHGVRAFVPRMMAQQTEGHVVNTGSVAGLTSNPLLGAYNVTKHGVVTLSETLSKDLTLAGSRLRVSVLCPGAVNTRILDSERNRPAGLAASGLSARPADLDRLARSQLAAGLDPDAVAEQVLDAIRNERFYVLTHEDWRERVRIRMDDILLGRTPEPLQTFAVPRR